MDCHNVRDRFSAQWEKELSPSEEAELRDHLRICAECEREFSRFDRALQMLHAAEEVEVPEGFLSGIYKKMEERKRGPLFGENPIKTKWFGISSSWRLPMQAVAMVAIVFLALYLTKMSPVERSAFKEAPLEKAPVAERPRAAVEAQAPRVEEKKTEMLRAPKELEKKREEVSASEERKDEAKAVEPVLEAKTSVPESKTATDEAVRPKEIDVPTAPLLKEKEVEEGAGRRGEASLRAEPYRDFFLKVSDREKTISQLQELVKQAGGETLKAEGKMLLVSIPNGAFSEFKREMEGIGSSPKPKFMAPARAAPVGKAVVPETKSREAEEKEKKTETFSSSKEGRILVRILLWEE